MNGNQWFVLGGIFILASFLILPVSLFFGGNQDCVEEAFSNFRYDGSIYATSSYAYAEIILSNVL